MPVPYFTDLINDVISSLKELGGSARPAEVFPHIATKLNLSEKDLNEKVKEITGDGFDVIFEASGARPALRQAFDLVKPGGTIVQIGTLETADIPLPANMVMVKEIHFIGSFRYGNVFDEAIRLVVNGRIDLRPFITGLLPFNDITKAMHLAADKVHALKVQLTI